MSEVKWIKITTDMFEDEKIDFIQSLPEADAIIVIWVRLLTMAGKCNSNGYIFLTENIPYDENMLAHKFRKPINIIKLAITTFKRLNMIEDTDKGLLLPNWEKHQNVDGLDKIKEQNRIRAFNYREKIKSRDAHVTITERITQGNATELDKELDKEKEISIVPKVKKNVPVKNSYAELVKMTSTEYEKLIGSYGEARSKRMVEVLDNYKGANNKLYANDYKAILNWVVERVLKENPLKAKTNDIKPKCENPHWRDM